MPCSKGSGPVVAPRQVRLTVYLAGGRILSHVYTRNQAALRLKWARHHEDYRGWKTEVV